jgi:hypothetical protein
MKLYMDTLPLRDLDLKKTAGFAARLSEKPDNWPQELTSDLYKQLPFLSDYEVSVNLDRVDEQRGFGFGYADVHNKTERPEQEHEQTGMPHVRIPLVVQERAVKPFSTFMDGEKVLPLNENRIREHLFNPQSFDLSASPPRDPSLVENLMPPHRSGIGMGGDYKMASADEKLLADLQGISKGKTAGAHKCHTCGGRATGMAHINDLPPRYVCDKHGPSKKDLEKASFDKTAFKHISPEQWKALHESLEMQQALHEYGGDKSHPAVQNRLYELALKHYGFHPKPEAPPAHKMEAFKAKIQAKSQKAAEKQVEKTKKMMEQGNKLLSGAQGGQKPAGGGSPLKMPANGIKKTGSLLLDIAPTIRESDAQKFVEKVASSASLQAGFQRSGISDLLVEVFDKTARVEADDRFRAIADSIEPTVVSMQKLPGGDFLVKSANSSAFVPGQAAQGQVIPGQEMAGAIGQDQAQAMQPGQTATAVAPQAAAAPPPAAPEQEDPTGGAPPNVPGPEDLGEVGVHPEEDGTETQAQVAEQFGEYLVQDMMGNQVMGWVFPKTLAWDGNFSPQPISLFTNGSAYAVQSAVAGEMIGKSTGLPSVNPRGEGIFYMVDRTGAKATAPVTVHGGMSGPDGGEMYTCSDVMGNQFKVTMSPGLTAPQRISDNEYALPKAWKFMALGAQQTQLVPDPLQMNKSAAVKLAQDTVTLFWNGSFNLEGGCGIEKLSSDYRYDLDGFSAEFMLGVLGVPGEDIKSKLAACRKKGAIKIAGREITLFSERYQEKKKEASAMWARIPNLARDLIKEAASMEDEGTVDKVLALNFINPENLTTFIDYTPELEEASEKLAAMLLSSYLGMKEIPEGAVERSMRNMEEVILALKAVQHAEQ